MLTTQKGLDNALNKILPVQINGYWHRAVDHEHLNGPPPGAPPGSPPQPLWPGGPKRNGGRYTPIGGAEAVYLSSDIDVSAQEVNAVFEPPGGPRISIPKPPTVYFQVEALLLNVLDLTQKKVLLTLRTNETELTGRWRTISSPPTHLLVNFRQSCKSPRKF
jgi:hypothetical protein